MKVSFIGLGNMASAILQGMLDENICKASDISGICHTEETARRVREQYGIEAYTELNDSVKKADMVILAVKPQVLDNIADSVKPYLNDKQTIVSVIAGKTIKTLSEKLGADKKIIRCMPNTPALVGEGVTGITCQNNVDDERLNDVVKIFYSLGKALVVSEPLLDTIGAVGGSAPAYVFMFMEALADAAVKHGMTRADAYEVAAQMTYGSAKLMLESRKHPGVLKDMVTSPGGTTIEGLEVLKKGGFEGLVMEAIDACMDKTKKL